MTAYEELHGRAEELLAEFAGASLALADLIAFLKARLDEDEATAKTATAVPAGSSTGDDPTDDEIYSVHDGIVDLVGVTVAFTRDRNVANGQHIARHDPARALREVAAGRYILDLFISTAALVEHPPVMGEGHPYAGKISVQDYFDARRELAVLRPVAVALAAIYSDHPDYEGWLQ